MQARQAFSCRLITEVTVHQYPHPTARTSGQLQGTERQGFLHTACGPRNSGIHSKPHSLARPVLPVAIRWLVVLHTSHTTHVLILSLLSLPLLPLLSLFF